MTHRKARRPQRLTGIHSSLKSRQPQLGTGQILLRQQHGKIHASQPAGRLALTQAQAQQAGEGLKGPITRQKAIAAVCASVALGSWVAPR